MVSFINRLQAFDEPADDGRALREVSIQTSDTRRNYADYLALATERENGHPINDVLMVLYEGEALSDEDL